MTLWQYRKVEVAEINYQVYYWLQRTGSCKSLAESIAPMLSSSLTDWYMGPGSPAVAASQTGSCTPLPLHNVLDPRVCAYFRPSARVYWSETWCRKGATSCLRVYRCLNIMSISTLWLRYWQIAYINGLRPLNPDLCFFRFLGWNLMRVLTWNRLFWWLWSPGHRVWWEWRHFPGPISQPRTPAPNKICIPLHSGYFTALLSWSVRPECGV